VRKTEAREVGGALAIDLRRDGHIMASENDVLGLRDPFFEERRRDGALVDIEEGNVVVGSLMKKDDELDEVSVGLLPEGLLATAEKVVQERRNVVRQCVRFQVIVERVVTVFGIETDFDIILGPMVTPKDILHLPAEVPYGQKNSNELKKRNLQLSTPRMDFSG
jgi:hypothetical protein